jgi:hypothetical protein
VPAWQAQGPELRKKGKKEKRKREWEGRKLKIKEHCGFTVPSWPSLTQLHWAAGLF